MWLAVIMGVGLAVEVLSYLTGGECSAPAEAQPEHNAR